ncbi:GNAT family N-acetyltransferase [Egicoccus sp. AB-alg6-2]|uniref:GNAT family N-acetyltransferase n=1 Tax=Egicoccus sp. AB-alg6-2 TaxID=3242692 RepID=UPI00359CD7C3
MPAPDDTHGHVERPVEPSSCGVVPLSVAESASVVASIEADEATTGAPVVDEAELLRLRRFAESGLHADDWQPLVARRDGEFVGYAGVRTSDPAASGDAATRRGIEEHVEVLQRLLVAAAERASDRGVSRLQVWVRQVGATEIAAAAAAGYAVDRRLGVLGRDLDVVRVVPPEEGWRIRASEPGRDDAGIVAVLAAAYEGTDEAGWTRAQLRERQGYDWFRSQDLLVAEDEAGQLGGLHWLKRRGGGQGEVYNLAIAPHAQGAGLGAALLTAGLDHLRRVGCDEVVLWVDRANERAVRLYERYGLTTRWDDVAFGRDLP